MKLGVESIREALHERPVGEHGDLGPPGDQALRPASVLLPFYEEAAQLCLLLVRRGEDLGAHAGQIAFPGGGRDPGEDELACALREAREEIGLDPAEVEILGRLDRYATVSSYLVSPFVGRLKHWPLTLTPQPGEVAGILEVPVNRLLEPGVLRTFERETSAGPREVNFFVVGDEVIWGATARMLRQLLELASGEKLRAEGEVPWDKVRF